MNLQQYRYTCSSLVPAFINNIPRTYPIRSGSFVKLSASSSKPSPTEKGEGTTTSSTDNPYRLIQELAGILHPQSRGAIMIYSSELSFYFWSWYKDVLTQLPKQDIHRVINMLRQLWFQPLHIDTILPKLSFTSDPEGILNLLYDTFTVDIDGVNIYLVNPPKRRFVLHTPPWREQEPVERMVNQRHQVKDSCNEILDLLNSTSFDLHPLVQERVKKGEVEDMVKGKGYLPVEKKIVEDTLNEYPNKSFRFQHFMDTRGRTYNNGYGLNYQGDDFHKSCLVLA